MEMQDSTRTTTVWQTENEIVIPVTVEETVTAHSQEQPKAPKAVKSAQKPVVKANHGVPTLLAYPYTGVAQTATAPTSPAAADSISGRGPAADSLAADSIGPRTIPGEEKEGIILINPASEYMDKNAPAPKSGPADGMSWIYLVLALLFCTIGVKFKGNSRYIKALMADLTDTRLRHNAFDDTVKETSLLFLLNVLWVACAGVLLWSLVRLTVPSDMTASMSIAVTQAQGIALCAAVAGVYLLVMTISYWGVGNVFSDRRQTQLWVKGASASYGLETVALFPLALLTLTYPEWNRILLIIAAAVFIFGKIVFLYKGFRIFFTQISSWLLFLYYLCSLEIVPLILAYVAAVVICTGSAL